MDIPKGLYYFDNIVDKEIGQSVLSDLDSSVWKPLSHKIDTGRLVQHFKHYYNYDDRSVKPGAPEMPESIKKICDILKNKCKELGLGEIEFDQCIANNYYSGEGISPHIDHLTFGPVIGSFTFNSGAVMKFTKDDTSYELYTEPQSLYIMSGEARYDWKHGMPKRTIDILDNNNPQTRGRRVSLTFRSVLKEKEINN